MRNILLTFAVVVGAVLALTISVLWIDFFVKILLVPTEDPVRLLVLGLDKDLGGTRRTDVIIVASLDLSRRKLTISSIPRDLIIEGGRINALFQREGLERFKKRIEDLVGFEIKRHVVVDYEIFKFLGDELGPVEVFVDRPMYYVDAAQGLEVNFSPGFHKMRGRELLAYLRFRKTAEGDIGRLDKQRVIIEKLAQSAMKKNLISLTALYRDVKKRTDFNMDVGELVYIFTKLRGGFTIESVPFPFYIGNDGNLYIDSSKLEDYRKALVGEKRLEERYRYYVINNSKLKSPDYRTRLERAFSENKPLRIFYDGVDVDFRKTTVLLLRKNEALRTFVVDLLRGAGLESFDVVYTEESIEHTLKYISIIGELSKNQYQIAFPIDFIVVLTEAVR